MNDSILLDVMQVNDPRDSALEVLEDKAYSLLREYKGDSYLFGRGVIDQAGLYLGKYGEKFLIVASETYLATTVAIREGLEKVNEEVIDVVSGARPNAPREDVKRICADILRTQPDAIIALGGGSTIDACKAADVLAVLGGTVDDYFGTGLVTKRLEETGKKLIPLLAVATAASSSSHLTKYANITDIKAGQKKLIVDPAIVPVAAVFDYNRTLTSPASVTRDGIMDALSHTFEVFCGAKPETFELTGTLARTALELCILCGQRLMQDLSDAEAREGIALASDLGGYAIMVGGTSGAHLTSFSLTDVTSHGTACGIMNPYYAVYYAPAVEPQLRQLCEVFSRYELVGDFYGTLDNHDLAVTFAEAWKTFAESIGAPTTLLELPDFTSEHIDRMLNAAKDPQLAMKLANMPVPMKTEEVDIYMKPVLEAAVTGDFDRIVTH